MAAIALESGILESSKADLSDLRIVAPNGALVPVTFTELSDADEPAPFPLAISKIVKKPGKWTDVWIDKGSKILSRGIAIQTSSTEFVRKVEVRGSDPGREEYVILMDALLADLTQPTPVRSLDILHPVNNFQYVHLRILDEARPPLKLDGVLCYPPSIQGPLSRPLDARIIESRTSQQDKSTAIIADLGDRRFPLTALRISVSGTAEFVRTVRLSRSAAPGSDAWEPFHQGTLFRLCREDAIKEELLLRFPPQLSRYVLLELSGGEPSVKVTAIEASATLRLAMFEGQPGATYRLYYDNPQAKASPTASPRSISLTDIAAGSHAISVGEERKSSGAPAPRPVAQEEEARPTTFHKALGIGMLLVGLLLLFTIMLKARSLRRSERRRNAHLLRTRL